ncbi:MAG: YHS domain-containing protein [Bacteroidetes bacterium]|nr:YHS domain-containing protein [Bacteroidota bacterium]
MKKNMITTAELRVKAIYLHESSINKTRLILKAFSIIVAALLIFEITNAQKFDGKFFNNVDANGVILDGYDAVAFFSDNKPVKGDAQFQYKYEDAIYYFASQDHLNLFKSNPEKYKPQFGAWCAYAVSLGKTAPIDVNTFSIVDGRLVIQHNQRAVSAWNKDVAGNLVKADKYWPGVSTNGGKQIVTDEEKGFLNNTDPDGVILQGYDAVGYFADNKAEQGNPKFSTRYNGATYWFSSEEHANTFKDNPAKYAPQYGAFCGYAMSLNKLRPIDPTIFQIVDGRLILQHTQDAYQQFNKDVAGNTAKADGNWPGQEKKHAGKKIKFDKPATPAPENNVTTK